MITLLILFALLSRVKIKPARRGSRRSTRTVTKTVYTLGTKTGPARTDPRTAEKLRREQFKREQAAADLVHYTQVKQDLLSAYNASGALYGDTEKAIRRRIAYDNSLRRVEKQIEKSAYDARTGL